MKTMRHKGYAARIEYSEEDGCFIGHIAGIRDVVGFHGESVKELRSAGLLLFYWFKVLCGNLTIPYLRGRP